MPPERSAGYANASEGSRRRIIVAAVSVIGAVVMAMFVLVLLAQLVLSHLFEPKHRKHLKPIPIDITACPSVEAIHAAANEFQIASSPLNASGTMKRWTRCV
jgi:hypothetical protein